jgi:type II secretory pathway component HofQ
VPWEQAFDVVLQANRLRCVKLGNAWRVSTITRVREEREAELAAEQAANELEPLKTAYVPGLPRGVRAIRGDLS